MKLISPVQSSEHTQLKVGELILKRFGPASALALMLAKDMRTVRYGLLTAHPRMPQFSSVDVDPAGTHLSYGMDWALQVLPDFREAPRRGYEENLRAGDLLIGGGKTILVFNAPEGFGDSHVCISLPDIARTDLPSEATRTSGWRIWATADDRLDPRARTIFNPEDVASDTEATGD